MASDKRPIIKLRSTAGTGFTYVTTKNKTNTRERIEIKKYDRSSASTCLQGRALSRGFGVARR